MSFGVENKSGVNRQTESQVGHTTQNTDMGPWSEQAKNLKSLWQLAWNVYNGNADANTAGPYANAPPEQAPPQDKAPTTNPMYQALLKQWEADNSPNYWDGGNYPSGHPLVKAIQQQQALQRQKAYSGELWNELSAK